jgi:hypothetical protein
MSWGDVLDLFTPLVLLPLYWLLYLLDRTSKPSTIEGIVFVTMAAIWAEGHGMHLAANSIGHLFAIREGDLYELTNVFDEVLSHYFWHVGILGLSTILIVRQSRNPMKNESTSVWVVAFAALIYGFTYFLIIIEGGTAPLGIPYAVLVIIAVILRARRDLKKQPLTRFFFVGSLVAVILFLIWGLYWGALPEFSELGLL